MKYLDKHHLSKIFIIVFHLVGIIGFQLTEYQEFFLSFVPYHLMLMAGILIANQKEYNEKFWQAVAAIFLGGFIIEVIGVATGNIFGVYSYGETLGFKVADVPLVIGLNWMMLIFCIGSFLKKHFKHQRNLKSLIGASLMLIIDILLEPVAIRFDYWTWQQNFVPFQNYVAWFVISFVFLRAYYEFEFRKTNPVAVTLLVSQILFFVVLNLTVV